MKNETKPEKWPKAIFTDEYGEPCFPASFIATMTMLLAGFIGLVVLLIAVLCFFCFTARHPHLDRKSGNGNARQPHGETVEARPANPDADFFHKQ
jgi:hypothetical protein